jgi:hypothetical protein
MVKVDGNPTMPPPEAPRGDATRDDIGITTAEAIAAAGFEVTRDVTLEDGQGFVGEYAGRGQDVEMVDLKGQIRIVPTFLFRRGNLRIRMIGAAMLARKLNDIEPGTEVAVVRLGQADTRNGNRITVYDVGIRRG